MLYAVLVVALVAWTSWSNTLWSKIFLLGSTSPFCPIFWT